MNVYNHQFSGFHMLKLNFFGEGQRHLVVVDVVAAKNTVPLTTGSCCKLSCFSVTISLLQDKDSED